MTEPRGNRLPQEFIDWLRDTLTPQQVEGWLQSFVKNQMVGLDWQNDEVYQYWAQYVAPPQYRIQPKPQEKQEEEQEEEQVLSAAEIEQALEESGYLDLMKQAASLAELDVLIEEAIQWGTIPDDENVTQVFNKYALQIAPIELLKGKGASDEVLNYLQGYTDKNDLVQRIGQLGLPQEIDPDALYSGLLASETGYTTAQKALKKQAATAEAQAQVERQGRSQVLSQALNSIYNNPNITQQDLKSIGLDNPQLGNEYIAGTSDEILKRIANLGTVANERYNAQRQAQLALASTSQRGMAQRGETRRLNELRARTQRQESMPDITETILEPIRAALPGEGTRLRSFIEQGIPGVVADTSKARTEWWNKLNPLPSEVQIGGLPGQESEARAEGFDAARRRIAKESVKWQPGGEFYQPGGLADIVQKRYADILRQFEGKSREAYDFRAPGFAAPLDPLLEAIAKKKSGVEYFRQPGTGISTRLSPSLRFR